MPCSTIFGCKNDSTQHLLTEQNHRNDDHRRARETTDDTSRRRTCLQDRLRTKLLHVITQDLPAFQRLYDDSLSTLPNVQRLTSTLVMKRVIQDRPLPL